MCGNKNPNKLKRSIVVGQEIIQAGAELVEKEGGEGKKRNIFLSLEDEILDECMSATTDYGMYHYNAWSHCALNSQKSSEVQILCE